MKHTSEHQYRHYTNKERTYEGVKARYAQRLKWIKGYNESGKFRNKLIAIGVLQPE